MKTRDEIEAELEALGWRVSDGPRADVDGWRATITCGALTISATGHGEIAVLEELLRSARRRAGEQSCLSARLISLCSCAAYWPRSAVRVLGQHHRGLVLDAHQGELQQRQRTARAREHAGPPSRDHAGPRLRAIARRLNAQLAFLRQHDRDGYQALMALMALMQRVLSAGL